MFVMIRLIKLLKPCLGWHNNAMMKIVNWQNSKYDEDIAETVVPLGKRLKVPHEGVSIADIDDEIPMSIFVDLPQVMEDV